MSSDSPNLLMLSTTLEPFLPRISLAASSIVKFFVSLPSILIMISPLKIPARFAGELSIGVITVS